jgi:hypothetical protein
MAASLLFAAVALTEEAGAREARRVPLVDSHGFWSLERMGYADQMITATEMRDGYRPGTEIAGRQFAFALPTGARQGPDDWYLFRLHYRLEIDERSGPGLITIGASSNGRAMAQILFRLSHSKAGLRVRGTSVGLVSGSQLRDEAQMTWEDVYTNFFQELGVRPGHSTLSVYVAQTEQAHVRSLRVFMDSGIIVTRNGPSSIELVPILRDRHIRVGEAFRVGYRVESVGASALPAGGTVTIQTSGLDVIGAESARLGSIPAGRSATGSFQLVAARPGTFPITLQVSSWGGTRAVELAAKVTARKTVVTDSRPGGGVPKGDASETGTLLLAAVLAAGAVALSLLGIRHARSRRR